MIHPISNSSSGRTVFQTFSLEGLFKDYTEVMDDWRRTEPQRALFLSRLPEADHFKNRTEDTLREIIRLRNEADGANAKKEHRISELKNVFVPSMKQALEKVEGLSNSNYKAACIIIDDIVQKIIDGLN